MLDYQAQEDAIRQFADVVTDAGLVLKGLPIMDGRLHHVPTLGAKSKSDNAGVYVGHLDDGVPAGWFNNYRTDPSGEGQKWKATGITDTRTAAEIQKAKEEAERRRAQEEQKRFEQEERIARWAERKWDRSAPAHKHSYLEKKGVEAHGLRMDSKNRLLVPMRDLDGKIWSLQTISADGEKHYTAGGRKKGLHTIVGQYNPARPLVFAEGFATAATVHQATGLAVAVVFDSGNLKPVAEAYRDRSPTQLLLFAADNDHHLPLRKSPTGRELPNVGVQKAQDAARAVNGSVLIPEFERGNPGTDWNDYAAQRGLAAVATAFGSFGRTTPGVSETPGVSKPEVSKPQRRSTTQPPFSKQEVSMAEQQYATASALENERATRPLDPRPEAQTRNKPLERLTRPDVERALQTGASLAQKDLSGLDLSNLKFDGINLAGSNLSGTRNVNTTYEASRLDGVNFSDAMFRNSTIERAYAVNSRWDGAQFDRTNIVFSNFANASFRDAVFRDTPRAQKQEQAAETPSRRSDAESQEAAQTVRQPARSTWAEVAARAGTVLKDIGRALKDVSAGAYQKVREWWMQPLQLAPEIDRNVDPAAWCSPAPTYGAYEQSQPQMWNTAQLDRREAQVFDHANVLGRERGGDMPRSAEPQHKAERVASNPADTRASEQNTRDTSGTSQNEPPGLAQPALIARNNFQFADFTGARFESIRVQDNDFRHAVLTNALFPAELDESNKVERKSSTLKQPAGSEIRESTEPLRPVRTEAERQQDRAELIETIKRDIEKRERGLAQGDSGMYRDTDALHLAKEMLRQVEAGSDRIDLTTGYKAVDGITAEERHVRAYNSVNPLIAEAYAKGIAVDRGSATLERAQAISDEAARLHEDVNATTNGQDRKDLIAETKSLLAEGVSLRTNGEAKESEIRADLDREGMTPLMTMEQDRFDALLSVGVFDFGKSPEWRKEMDQKITECFAALSTDASVNAQDRRTLWHEAAKQVQQGELLRQQPRETSQDRSVEMADQSQILAQRQEMRRSVALAR
jgi:phage/plasmid primase-like uncharacterized protein